jgi:hypothetical protein
VSGQLYPREKSPQYPLDRRLDGPQSRSGRRGEDKILDTTGTRTPTLGRPARSQSLYQLRYIYVQSVEKLRRLQEFYEGTYLAVSLSSRSRGSFFHLRMEQDRSHVLSSQVRPFLPGQRIQVLTEIRVSSTCLNILYYFSHNKR